MNIKEYENYHEKKEHGVETFPYNTYLCSIPLDFAEVPVHWHDEMEIIYIKKGRGVVSVEFEERQVCGGDYVIVLPGQLHAIRQAEDERMEYENIMFRPQILYGKQDDGTSEKYFRPILRMKVTIPTFYHEGEAGYDAIRRCLDQCDAICEARQEGYELLVKAQLLLVFFLLYTECADRTPHKIQQTHEQMKTVLKYVEFHYGEKLTIEQMANLVGFSSSHFMKYFKTTMGQSFIDYLNDYRLVMASRLLLSSEDSVLEIAQEVGFTNISYFNRIFKRRFEMTPREYRRKFAQK